MRKLLAIFTLFTFLFASCEKEEPVAPVSDSERIYATIEKASDTKAELAQDNSDQNKTLVLWEENDEISVFVKIGEEVKNVKFVLESGAGETTGVFVKASGEISLSDATYVSALYPYSAAAVHNTNSKIISNLTAPASYTYSEVKKSKAAPMAGVFSNNTISFKNIGAIVKVSTTNIPDGYNTIVLGSENNIIAGDYKISLNNSGVASVVLDENGSKHITYEIGANKDIYIPIFPGTYNDMYLKAVKSASEEMILFSTKALTAVRSTLYSTSVVLTTAESQEQLEEIIENNVSATNIHVDLGNDVNDVTIPKTESTKAVSLTFTTDEEEINVTEGTGTDVAVQGNVNINIDSDNSTDTKKLNINLPSSTVTVAGNTTYEKIIASTADNTLILDAGTVAKLVVVEKGNIQVNAGARLESIQLDGVTSVVIIDNGGTINDAVRSVDGVTVMSKAEWDFRVTLESGNIKSYTLTEDLTITGESINISSTFTLLVDGCTLTYTGNDALFRISNAAMFNITCRNEGNINTIASNPTETTLNGSLVVASEGSEIRITNGTYSVGTNILYQLSGGSTLTVSGNGMHEARADLIVNGNSNFYNSDKSHTIKLLDDQNSVYISGGTFVGYNPSITPYGNLVNVKCSSIYDAITNTYSVKSGIYNAVALQKCITEGTGNIYANLYADIEIDILDLTNLKKAFAIKMNGYKFITKYGVKIAPKDSKIYLENGEIVVTKEGTSSEHTAGIQFEDGDYSSSACDFRNLKIKMPNNEYAYPINVAAGVTNLYLYLANSELEGSVAFQCWGDTNEFLFFSNNYICNFTTTENLTSSCIAFQNDGTNIAENNTLTIYGNSLFKYSGTNDYNKEIYSIINNSDTNTISFANWDEISNNSYEGVTPYQVD